MKPVLTKNIWFSTNKVGAPNSLLATEVYCTVDGVSQTPTSFLIGVHFKK
jgi:hypothetical protein